MEGGEEKSRANADSEEEELHYSDKLCHKSCGHEFVQVEVLQKKIQSVSIGV